MTSPVRTDEDSSELFYDVEQLAAPATWTCPHIAHVCGGHDLFHSQVSTPYIMRVFDAMIAAPGHIFQIVTQEADRLTSLQAELPWSPNIALGMRIENQKQLSRVDHLIESHAHVKFLAFEPLSGPIVTPALTNYLEQVDWVVASGDSRHPNHPVTRTSLRDLSDACLAEGVPSIQCQWSGYTSLPEHVYQRGRRRVASRMLMAATSRCPRG